MSEGFDPRLHRYPESRYFEDLAVGERFYIPSRTMTEAHFSAFQTLSADNHPIHYDVEYCRERGHPGPLAHGFQVLCFTAAGAGTFAHVIGESLIALNAKSGQPYPTFGTGGAVNLHLGTDKEAYSWSGAPRVCRDVVIVGASMSDSPPRKEGTPGDVRGYDARTGQLRWTFHVVPRAGEFGVDTWKDNSWQYTGHTNLWSLISVDEQLGYAYLPLTSPTSDMYGGHRAGDNLFSDSLVAVECQTGKRVWHYQLVRHDLWDYDLPAAPILADITVDGRRIRSVVQLTKQAFAFVFDRATGQPVWPIEDRPVPQSKTPGEQTAATQPFPTKPPAFDRQGVTVDDLIDFTPALRAAALDIVKQYVIGPMFTPPSLKGPGPNDTKGTIQLPGSVGGADWQGGAFDPETGLLYVQSITGPFVADIIPMALGLAIGQGPGGTSLDNTVRVVLAEPTDDWILLDIEAEGMNRSIGCGRVRLWRRDGTLIGVGTQSAIVRTSHHPTYEPAPPA